MPTLRALIAPVLGLLASAIAITPLLLINTEPVSVLVMLVGLLALMCWWERLIVSRMLGAAPAALPAGEMSFHRAQRSILTAAGLNPALQPLHRHGRLMMCRLAPLLGAASAALTATPTPTLLGYAAVLLAAKQAMTLASLSALGDYSGNELERVLEAQMRLTTLAQHN
ncbi:MAG: hypothetical protein M3Z95_04705 [Actinomycetota bacterium]|nr:hypothetical protein [Actinomycetota bacterium]